MHTIQSHLYYTLAFRSLELPESGSHFVVDIGDTLEAKMAAVKCYQTQFPPEKQRHLDRIRAFNMQQGAAAGFAAGELLASPTVLGTRSLMNLLFD